MYPMWAEISLTGCCCWAGDSIPSTVGSSMSTSNQPGHSRSTTSAMTVSDQSTTTGFSDSQPVMQHQREMSDISTLSGVPSGEMPGRTGASALFPQVTSVVLKCSRLMFS